MSKNSLVEISDVFGLSKPVQKLIDSVSNAVGEVWEPKKRKLLAKARADEIRVVSDAISENIDLPIKYESDAVTIDTTDFSELQKRTATRLYYQELKKQQHIDNVVEVAYDLLSSEDEVSDDPVDLDWITRFMNSVEDISSEQMQRLWGKLLAGEIKKPNTFSLRTLEKIKNLTTEEAQLFERVSHYAIHVEELFVLPVVGDLLKLYMIDHLDLVKLNECGLVSTESLTLSLGLNLENQFGIIYGDLFGIFRADVSEIQKLKIVFYPITESGAQLLSLFDQKPNDHYFFNYLRMLKNELHVRNLSITAHKKVDDFNYEDSDLVEIYEHDFLNILPKSAIKSLGSIGVSTLNDLQRKSEEELKGLNGISERTYQKLVDRGYHFPGMSELNSRS